MFKKEKLCQENFLGPLEESNLLKHVIRGYQTWFTATTEIPAQYFEYRSKNESQPMKNTRSIQDAPHDSREIAHRKIAPSGYTVINRYH